MNAMSITLRESLDLMQKCGLSIKTRGHQRWEPSALMKSETIASYLDCVVTVKWGVIDHEEWARLAIIDVQSDPPFQLYVCE